MNRRNFTMWSMMAAMFSNIAKPFKETFDKVKQWTHGYGKTRNTHVSDATAKGVKFLHTFRNKQLVGKLMHFRYAGEFQLFRVIRHLRNTTYELKLN